MLSEGCRQWISDIHWVSSNVRVHDILAGVAMSDGLSKKLHSLQGAVSQIMFALEQTSFSNTVVEGTKALFKQIQAEITNAAIESVLQRFTGSSIHPIKCPILVP